MRLKHILVIAGLALTTTLVMGDDSGCTDNAPPTSDQKVAVAQETSLSNAVSDVGMPAISNYTEMRLVKQLYEMRDDPKLVTYTYLQGLDGRLTCLGESVGYGIPYAVQFSNPQKILNNRYDTNNKSIYDGPITQAEPNGLYPPSATAGTWVFLYDKDTHQGQPTYIEPNVTVSRFKLSGPAVAKECE